jgi:hypothetical protein
VRISIDGTREEVMLLVRQLAGAAVDNAAMVASVPETPATLSLPLAFAALVEDWADGFDPDGCSHWGDEEAEPTDRAEALRSVAIGRANGKSLAWVQAQGGLTRAVHSILDGEPFVSRALAVNMAQVSSIVFPDLADLLEHFDPFEE